MTIKLAITSMYSLNINHTYTSDQVYSNFKLHGQLSARPSGSMQFTGPDTVGITPQGLATFLTYMYMYLHWQVDS